jgi:hypothetical protein
MSVVEYSTKRAHGQRRRLMSGMLVRLGALAPASRGSAGEKAFGQEPHVGAVPPVKSKLYRGLWSRFHAQRLLKGPAGRGPAYQSVEDDYQRLSRGVHERAALWQR